MKTVRDLGEDALIQRVCGELSQASQVLIGPGDDCAVINHGQPHSLSLLKTDAVVEGVHFLPSASPRAVGWKAVARVLSDFAAMGGSGKELMVTLAIPKETELSWVDQLYQGMSQCAEQFQTTIVGGETTSVPTGNAKVISISGRGQVEKNQLVSRSGGSPGDFLYVTGQLGGSLAGRHLSFTPRLAEANWLTKHFSPTAMMDLSDGLARDLPRLATASHCGYAINPAKLPRHQGCTSEQALDDGEDFELLFSISPKEAKNLETSWPSSLAPITHIGNLEQSGGELKGGWGHFE